MDQYVQQLSALGFRGFDTFFYVLPQLAGMYGSVKAFQDYLQDNGFDKISGVFYAYPYSTKFTAPHVRETHDRILEDCKRTVGDVEGLSVESFIVEPSSTCFQVEPVTEDKIKTIADCWSRVGEMTSAHGMKTTCHFEFWGAVRTVEQLETFMTHTDPRYVSLFIDTAQQTISGVDPTDLFLRYRDRVSGFHFKDTHDIDTSDVYRTPPDAEVMADGVRRWFWEMGTEEGLVDFPRLMREIVKSGWDGWLTVEHDKADIGGGNYAEATAVAKWYIENVLTQVEQDAREDEDEVER
ncbi:sugar phosphate isomerase/epimerase family protein [Propionibacterium australiense]|nr:TIM barrel protein [Propionibacterium australiense]SYZ34543.1 Xylose isomerase-like TIM barrel [Propionibacterium australiense]VEH89681.1 Inosose dehydratase [Propionibacterium australiense]